ncbi:ECF transporter S component [Candidatus Bathyarchaeota archaeon]|nr:ECF transporter S component [Candidatus Bathyarchaeota archaeon]
MKMRAFDVAIIGICAALYAVIGRLTDLGLTVGGVSFLPAVVIPAVFAVLFGPWTGGVGAAIGIFIKDMITHGDPLLSLTAGVTSNFVAFFLIGYISRTELDSKKIITSLIIGSATILAAFLLPDLSVFQIIVLFVGTVISTLIIIAVVYKFAHEWKSYTVGSVIGIGVGSVIIPIVLWAYSQILVSPNVYNAPLQLSIMPIIFVWTFATEIPFILFLGPPIIKACYKAFPSLKKEKGKKEEKNN